MTSQEEPQASPPYTQAAGEPPTQAPSEQPPSAPAAPTEQAATEQLPIAQGQAQPQPPQPPWTQPPVPPYPFAPVAKLPWIAPARKGAVIAIGVAAAVVMFGAGIGAGAAIFHNDQANRPSYQFHVPNFGQRQIPGFPGQLPTPSPSPSQTS